MLYEEALPATLQLTLQDCVSVHEANGVWERLHEKFPPESIPRAILFKLKKTKPMASNSAREMRRVLEKIKEYSRRAKDANCNGDLNCHVTLDLIAQKLTTTLVRNFRRYLHSENEQASVDTLIRFLQTETELEERFANELSLNVTSKPKSSTINQVRSNSDDRCTLCNKSRHKFVECERFMSYSPQQRTDAMRRLHRCFTCLLPMHKDPRDCYYRRRCTSCSRSHHTLLACVSKPEQNKIRVENSQQNSSLNANASSFQPSQASVRSTNECAPNFRYSPTALVELLDTNGTWHKAVALFDSGSDVTLIKKDIVKKLQLERHPKTFKFGVAGGGYRYEKSAIVSVWIRRFDKRSCRYNINALELEKPAHPSHCLKNELFEDLSYLKAIKKYLPKENSAVDILIGYDYANLMAPMSYLRHPTEPNNYPTAAETSLGWYVFGPNQSESLPEGFVQSQHVRLVENDLLCVKSWYEANLSGVKPTEICTCFNNDIKESQFLKHVKKTIHLTKDGRVEVSMPWKEGFPVCLKFNRHQALSNLKFLERRLVKSNLLQSYNEEMSQIIKEFAEPVPEEEISRQNGWYLNHFPVLSPGKSTSCRIAWNSAAKYNGFSLNDGLHKGPDLLNNLFHVLIAWRNNTIAIAGDIRKMFNQIKMKPADRIYHRFLWRNGNIRQPPNDYQWKRLSFEDKPAPDLSISALHYLADKLSSMHPIASQIIKHHCYMDDIVTSLPSEDEAIMAKEGINVILAKGKFSVKGWHSNSLKVDEFPDQPTLCVLGHNWDKSNDMFKPKIPNLKITDSLTKRTILGVISKFWDPIGIFAPVTLRLRILLQSLWLLRIFWDDPVSKEIESNVLYIIEEMQALNQVELPRSVKPDNVTGNAELHEFCDGGEQAYGAAIWLRWPTSDGFVLRFVAAKSFVAPIKRKSTPRLELLGALILSRMLTSIKTIIAASNVYMWTDSAVVLHWLSKPSSKFKAFVSTRVQEIQESLSDIPACFKYIDSKLNPADALTKPIHVSKLAKWHLGPQFLVLPPKEWPLGKPPLDKLSSTAQGEEKCPPPFVLHSEQLINFTSHLLARISSWQKLVRVVAWLKRPLINRENRISILTSRELTNAKLCLFWIAQDYLREPEQQRLRKRMNLKALNTQPALLRICGRLSNFSYNDEVTKPIALLSNNKIVVLYADYMHRKLGH